MQNKSRTILVYCEHCLMLTKTIFQISLETVSIIMNLKIV